MNVRYIGKTEFLVLTKEKSYEVIEEKHKLGRLWYKIIDDSEEAYWYPADIFVESKVL